jgi:hypothetical protein
LLLFVGPACVGSSDLEGLPEAGIARRETPEGEAVVQLVVEPREITLGEKITLRLVNRGEVELLGGLVFDVERWDGRQWVQTPWSRTAFFPLLGLSLAPGQSTPLQRWPDKGMEPEPGVYRAVKSASYEDPEFARPDVELEARTTFLVHA